MKARANRSNRLPVDPSLKLSPTELDSGLLAYKDWHWGIPAVRVLDWNDPDLPRRLVECGRLIRLDIRMPIQRANLPRKEKDMSLTLAKSVSTKSHVTYDPDHENQRLYLLVPKSLRAELARVFFAGNPRPALPLGEVAARVGGIHADPSDYQKVMVKPIGALTNVVYWTHKKDDGPSFYIHAMGEISHLPPAICVDQSGRLWIAGGNYTAPTPGITD